MTKGIIYYTDNSLEEPIFSAVQKEILKANIPVTSVSLKPIHFGKNIVVPNLRPNIITMTTQIVTALKNAEADIVFFCEHDVLYPLSHFKFTPIRSDIYYYNANVWRWKYPENKAIRYDRLMSLSGLCVSRALALSHYTQRLTKMIELGYINDQRRHEPEWARKWGYEPGTKKRKRGGFSDDDFETWRSEVALIDIRHKKTFSPPKVTLDGFKHPPKNWEETTLDKIKGWNFSEIFPKTYK